MTDTTRATLPTASRFQCPACGTPVTKTELRVARITDEITTLVLEDCGHAVTLEMLRDSWGIDVPEPDPLAVRYP